MRPICVYAIVKQGVYRHEVGGIYSSIDKAIAAVKGLVKLEEGYGKYHSYVVVCCDLDAPPVLPDKKDWSWIGPRPVEDKVCEVKWLGDDIVVVYDKEGRR